MPSIQEFASLQAESPANLAVQQTLSQQMRLTAPEIEDRKRLLGIDDHDTALLNSCRNHIHGRIDVIVEQFYEIQTKTPEIALVIGDLETLTRLQRAMRAYILEMFGGSYDADYVNKRLRIGKVHKRMGVSPKLYTTALRILHRLLDTELDTWGQGDPESTSQCKMALQKLFMFDIQLVFDTYIASLVAEVEVTKNEVERYALSLEEQVASRTRELAELSRQDVLTGLANQMSFYEHLRRECSASERSGQPVCLMYMDLNNFKIINDTHGHQAGDRMLKLFANVLKAACRDVDIPCRYGGDEFCLIMPRTLPAQASVVAKRLTAALDEAKNEDVTISMGIAVSEPSNPVAPDDLVKLADIQMYKAKAHSKDEPGHHIFVHDSERAIEALAELWGSASNQPNFAPKTAKPAAASDAGGGDGADAGGGDGASDGGSGGDAPGVPSAAE